MRHLIGGQIPAVPREDIFKDRYHTLCSKAISRGLEAEQKGRVHTEQKELHFDMRPENEVREVK